MKRLALLCAVALAAAGCGSTVQQVSGNAPANSDTAGANESGPPKETLQTGRTPSTAPADAARPSAVGSDGAGAGAGQLSAPGAAGPSHGRVPVKGPGWDAKFVYVGVVTQKDTQQVFAAFGANNVDPGDTEGQATAAVNDVNSRGGVLGRQIKIRFYDIKTIETAQNGSSVGEAVCTHFTQDHPVIAVWNESTQLDQVPTMRGCLAKARVAFFTAAARAIDDNEMDALRPHYYHTLMVSWDRLAPVFVTRLKAQGWFGGWDATFGQPASTKARVGILADDSPQGTHTASALKAAIARAGYSDTLVYEYSDPSQGQASSVSYFKGNGATHVIVTDVELTAFQSAAASQHYTPRYGITTYNDPYSNLEASGFTSTSANKGALGVGWAPAFDVSQVNDPGGRPAAASCLKVMSRGGQGTMNGKRLAQAYAFSLCDTMNLIAQGAGAGSGFTAAAVYAGIMRIGSSFRSANAFASALSPEKLYVPGVVRDIGWDTNCSCMRYGKAMVGL